MLKESPSIKMNSGVPTDRSGVHVSSNGVPEPAAHNFAVNGWTINYGGHSDTLYSPQQANLAFNQMLPVYFIVYQGYETDSPDWEVFGQVAFSDGGLAGYWF
jgi:hypothetical protein